MCLEISSQHCYFLFNTYFYRYYITKGWILNESRGIHATDVVCCLPL